ncbi:glycosyltransferase family 4 protein [Vacuolonema iberomarrocanum]|uniref:glycosyltransferase family 4 protein n=1 Tax=Vacuolonema iberomarrocanum TaxID=3454632 RepID=UPI0019E978CE|nr:glycosyltransferase family 4 protein [filamentous cyanobacterium LEGE 07170]
MSDENAWICCQLGAREHYAIPRSLYAHQELAGLITDAWVLPDAFLSWLAQPMGQSLVDRFHEDLNGAVICHSTLKLLGFEAGCRWQRRQGWTKIIARNEWFQRQAQHYLIQLVHQSKKQSSGSHPPTLFAYSYAALDLFQFAKSQGWRIVLGQIDPGWIEEAIVQAEHQRHPHLAPVWHPAPSVYWERWQQECALADVILVNSAWSQQALEQAGISQAKLHVVPLAYQVPDTRQPSQRRYPTHFSDDRPLRVLFLGQVILRKGIAALLDAAQSLCNLPIEFWIVGALGIVPLQRPNIRWIGAVPRSQVAQYFQAADVFLFPTLSDGFGLTQLEAQAWKLPIIASRYCGDVVKDQRNGLILSEVSGEAIASVLEQCLNDPTQLQTFSDQSIDLAQFSLDQLHQRLHSLPYAPV